MFSKRSRVWLLVTVASCVPSSAESGTRTNPYFKEADSKTAEVRAASVPYWQAQGGVRTAEFDQAKRAPIRRLPAVKSAAPAPRDSFGGALPDSQVRHAQNTTVDSDVTPATASPSQAMVDQRFNLQAAMEQHQPATSTVPPPVETPPTRIATAARRQAALNQSAVPAPNAGINRWKPTVTSQTCDQRAKASLANAYQEYSVSAWASAEASAWEALEFIATGIDVESFGDEAATRTNALSAVRDLDQARRAVMEVRDFRGGTRLIDRQYFATLVASHRTQVFGNQLPEGVTPAIATEQYFEFARQRFARLATAKREAAQAIDLLAAIYLGRNEAGWLPLETALCLRRAALQGQPDQADLAAKLAIQLTEMGIHREAQQMLRHVVALKPELEPPMASQLAAVARSVGDVEMAQRLGEVVSPAESSADVRMPKVVQLTPDEFASISPPVNLNPGHPLKPSPEDSVDPSTSRHPGSFHQPQWRGSATPQTASVPVRTASARRPHRPTTTAAQHAQPSPNPAQARRDTGQGSVPTANRAYNQIYSPESIREHYQDTEARSENTQSPKKSFFQRLSRFW
jgi:hypothetical protein